MTDGAMPCFLFCAYLAVYSSLTVSAVQARNGNSFGIHRRDVDANANPTLEISGLEAVGRSANSAILRWENATGPYSGYEVTVCQLHDRSQCHSAQTQKTIQKLKNLESGFFYEARVRAYLKADGQIINGKTKQIIFSTIQVPSVRDLEATRVESTSVHLAWAPANGSISHFAIDACPDSGAACVHGYAEEAFYVLEALTPETTYDIRVRSVIEQNKELSFGPTSNVSATTTKLPPLHNVSVRATCDSFITASWEYSVDAITGFLLNLCADGHSCITRTVDKADREHTLKVDPVLRQYTLSLEAYIWKGNAKHSSAVHNASVTSFPEVPSLDGFEVEAVSLREVKATWKIPIQVDVRLHVCAHNSPRKNCVNYVAHGTELTNTISGLLPSTKYFIEASGAVTLGASTCLGLGTTREVTTLTEAVCRPDEELKESVKELSNNMRALAERLNGVEARTEDDAVHSKCKAIEDKLRTLSEEDLADCLQDIDKILENYPRKTAT